MLNQSNVRVFTAICKDGCHITDLALQNHPSSRATRLVDDPKRLLFVKVGKKADDYILHKSISSWTKEGIRLDNVYYRFFGFTEAQVKVGKLIFFREDDQWTVERLLSLFGDLNSVYIQSGYGKYSARLGLSFSSTVQSLDVPTNQAVQVPDLSAPDGSLHTDGCGMIRDSFADQVCRLHGLPLDTSVFQIRRGGIKGILVRYPDDVFDELCHKYCGELESVPLIAYRPSMHKYDGGPTVLELNNVNEPPATARLNVQFTVLLLTLGVPLEVFKRLLQNQLNLIGSIATDRERALAYIKGELDAAAEDNLVQKLYEKLLAQQDLSEPTVRQELHRFRNTQYDSLRNKLNLRVHDSCYLYGIVDEYNVLQPDEVFINLPTRAGVLVRDVVVGRNPAYHPGDLRKLRAMDYPELRHLSNCIVFSRTASHSVPDTMAGGDLDGDKFFVMWDPSLIPIKDVPPRNRAPSAAAAAQTGRNTRRTPATRRVSDMPAAARDTFMQLKFSRLLGTISNEWSNFVEKTPQLAEAPYAQELVPLIESALDIMKSGEDFRALESQFKTLQCRYGRQCSGENRGPIQELRGMIPDTQKEAKVVLDGSHCDPTLILRNEDPQLWERCLSEARSVMLEYNRKLWDAIRLDNILDITRSERDESEKHADHVNEEYQGRYFGGGNLNERMEQCIRASAWYYYGYTLNRPAFSWLGARCLNEIKALWSNGNRPILSVGAVAHRPSVSSSAMRSSRSPLARYDSEVTLVDDGDPSQAAVDIGNRMDVDEHIEPRHKTYVLLSECPARRRREPPTLMPSPPTQTPASQCASPAPHHRPVRVSVASNPKPRAPVAMEYDLPNELCPDKHLWGITANGKWRRYFCKTCGTRIEEKDEDGYWVNSKVVTAVRRRDEIPVQRFRRSPTPDSLRPSEVAVPSGATQDCGELTEVDEDGADEDDAMSTYMSADDREVPAHSPRPSPALGRHYAEPDAPRRSSAGTTSSDAPSSLAGFTGLRRFPRARAGVDASSPVGCLHQVSRRTSSGSASATTTEYNTPRTATPATPAREPPARSRSSRGASVVGGSSSSPEVRAGATQHGSVLVSENPKPSAPVATVVTRKCRASAAHTWRLCWANGTHRNYRCPNCAAVVTERKLHDVWVPVH